MAGIDRFSTWIKRSSAGPATWIGRRFSRSDYVLGGKTVAKKGAKAYRIVAVAKKVAKI